MVSVWRNPAAARRAPYSSRARSRPPGETSMFGSERFAGAPSFGGATALHEEQTPTRDDRPAAGAQDRRRRLVLPVVDHRPEHAGVGVSDQERFGVAGDVADVEGVVPGVGVVLLQDLGDEAPGGGARPPGTRSGGRALAPRQARRARTRFRSRSDSHPGDRPGRLTRSRFRPADPAASGWGRDAPSPGARGIGPRLSTRPPCRPRCAAARRPRSGARSPAAPGSAVPAGSRHP